MGHDAARSISRSEKCWVFKEGLEKVLEKHLAQIICERLHQRLKY